MIVLFEAVIERDSALKPNDYQAFTRSTAIYPKNKALEYLTLGLASEAGEVAGVVKKHIRDGKSLEGLCSELGDVLWYITRLADELGLNLQDVIDQNVEKLSSRKERGVLGGSGDYR